MILLIFRYVSFIMLSHIDIANIEYWYRIPVSNPSLALTPARALPGEPHRGLGGLWTLAFGLETPIHQNPRYASGLCRGIC